VGDEASSEVTADDYRTVLIPMVDEARAKGKIRLLYVYDDVGISMGGAMQDAKVGIENWTAFEKIAVVTDKDWIENSIKAMGWIMPGEVKVFDDDDRDDAVKWLASS
jgi:hypothetical protein